MNWKQMILVSVTVAFVVVGVIFLAARASVTQITSSEFIEESWDGETLNGDELATLRLRDRRKDRGNDGDSFFEPTDEEPENRLLRRDRRIGLFDGSRLQAIGKGCCWVAIGIVALSLAVSFAVGRLNRAAEKTGL